MTDLEDRVYVVTGAAGGIGAAIARRLRARSGTVIGVDAAPVSHPDDVVVDLSGADCGTRVAAAVGDRPLHGLVNNAAVASFTSLRETALEDWERIHAVNLRAPFLLGVALHGPLAEAGGAIVNVSSVHARATSPGAGAYAAAKGGLSALTRSMALEWAEDGIRVNAVLPGAVDTPMLRLGLERSGMSVSDIGSRAPIGRVAEPGDVAAAIEFLLLPGSELITGAELLVDGGAMARLSTE